jgi:hypothetical protein
MIATSRPCMGSPPRSSAIAGVRRQLTATTATRSTSEAEIRAADLARRSSPARTLGFALVTSATTSGETDRAPPSSTCASTPTATRGTRASARRALVAMTPGISRHANGAMSSGSTILATRRRMDSKRCTGFAMPVRRSGARWGEVIGSASKAYTSPSARRAATLACWLLFAGSVVAACGDHSRGASCANVLTWRGEHYFGVATASADFPPRGDALSPSGASNNGCGKKSRKPRRVTVLRMGSTDPAIQLWVRGQARVAFLHPGYVIALPTHPLHRAFFGTDTSPTSAVMAADADLRTHHQRHSSRHHAGLR